MASVLIISESCCSLYTERLLTHSFHFKAPSHHHHQLNPRTFFGDSKVTNDSPEQHSHAKSFLFKENLGAINVCLPKSTLDYAVTIYSCRRRYSGTG